ncbi:phosphoribosyltransferase family protein [Micromonospora tulbaghiae]|uniref:phosphoribosyltransferase family protein n=1 Tax=Micromonospora tulbaghiae TaxID=479978 RepID=UPI0013C46ED1|nr:phosphoribosyltransferase family protein [Micromonospora tulbaghiae]
MNTHRITIGGLARDLPIVPVDPEIAIAFLKLYGDLPLVDAATDELAARLDPSTEVIVGPETGGILLAHKLAEKTGRPYAVVRKRVRPNMTSPLTVPVQTIGTATAQQLVLGDDDAAVIRGRAVAVVDEVVSSGGTLVALGRLMHEAGAHVVQTLAVATEGDRRLDVVALCHLPVFPRAGAAARP